MANILVDFEFELWRCDFSSCKLSSLCLKWLGMRAETGQEKMDAIDYKGLYIKNQLTQM
jgi:hypothetical protein